MRLLFVAALLFSAKLLDALPTGRYMGSGPKSAAPLHADDDIFVDEGLQNLWSTAPSPYPHPLPQMAAPFRAHASQPLASALMPIEHATGQVGLLHATHSPTSQHHTEKQVFSRSDGSSTHSGSSWSLSDLHLLSPIRWDSPPSTSQHSPPLMPAPDHSHMGHSAPSISEPASKRLKKHQAVSSPHPHHHTSAPVVPASYGSSTGGGPTPSSRHIGSHDHALASSTATSPPHAPQVSPKPLATKKSVQFADKWKKAGITLTEEANPLDVQASLATIRSMFKGTKETSLRGSVLRTAVASVADGCTSKAQYIKCMNEKYGKDLVNSHTYALGRIINNDMKDKGTYGEKTSSRGAKHLAPHAHTAAHNSKWLAGNKGAQQSHLWLNLPPTDRIEPPLYLEDVDRYHELIKHLDPYQLSPGDYVKHAYRPFEEAPDRWHKRIPKMAIDDHLRSKNVSEAMYTQIKKILHQTVSNVSSVRERGAHCTADDADEGKQTHHRQRYHTSSDFRVAKILAANNRYAASRSLHQHKSSKPRAAPSSPPVPH